MFADPECSLLPGRVNVKAVCAWSLRGAVARGDGMPPLDARRLVQASLSILPRELARANGDCGLRDRR